MGFGSNVSLVTELLKSYASPLYGILFEEIHFEPLSPQETLRFFKQMRVRPEEWLSLYCGGDGLLGEYAIIFNKVYYYIGVDHYHLYLLQACKSYW